MANMKVPKYFKSRTSPGQPTRYYWSPGPGLRAKGWRTTVLSTGLADAIDQARRLNVAATVGTGVGGGEGGPAASMAAIAPRADGRPTPGRLDDGTVEALIEAYRRSRFYLEKKPATRARYDSDLRAIAEWAGDRQAGSLTPANVEAWYDQWRHVAPRKARGQVVMLGTLYQAGRRLGFPGAERNPAEKPGIAYAPAQAPVIWPRAAVNHFIATADAMGLHALGTAVCLNEWLGQRKPEVLALGRRIFRGGSFYLGQSKTGALVTLPVAIVPRLATRIEAELARQQEAGVAGLDALILNPATGRPYAEKTFDRDFAAVRAEAAKAMPAVPLAQDPTLSAPFEDLWFIRLRHTAVVRMAEAGSTKTDISAVTGHKLATIDKILEHYWVPTPDQAEAAFRRRMEKEGE